MRRILVGVLVVMVGMAGPAAAAGGMYSADPAAPAVGGSLHFTNPSAPVVEENVHGAGAEFGLAVASSALSILYFPARFVFGVVGAGVGGFAGWTTGGDMRVAKGIWRPTTEGHYFMRPDYLDGTERFRFNGAVPARRQIEVVEEERVVVVAPAPVSDTAGTLDSSGDDDETL